MSQRKHHLFRFKGEFIAKAASAEASYHAERMAWWRGENDKAVATARASGIEIREYPVSGGMRAEMVLDPSLQKRIDETRNKIETHRRLADEFRLEASAYSTAAGQDFDLDPDDVQHFRLAGGGREA